MKAVVFDGNNIDLKQVDVSKLSDGEALVKVELAGICNTDLEIIKGYAGFTGTLGHEFVGTVVDVKGSDKSLLGKRVVGEINIGCEKSSCFYCNIGLQRHCPDRQVVGIHGKDGAMAEYLNIPISNLLVVPDNVSSENAVLVEPFAAGFEILEQVHIKPADKIAILGDGKLGLLINIALSTVATNITHIGKHLKKLNLIAKNCNTIMLNNLDKNHLSMFDVVIDATGSASGINTALDLVKPRGVVVLKTTVSEPMNIDMTKIVVNELTVLGSRCGLFAPAVKALSKGLDISFLIEKVYKLEEFAEAFERASKKGSLKVALRM